MASIDPTDAATERRGRLLGAKLRGLVAEHAGEAVSATPTPLPIGVAMLAGPTAWVLVDGAVSTAAAKALGPALAWTIRQEADRLAVVSDVAVGTLTRRAEWFDFPIDVWFPEQRVLLPGVAEPLAAPSEPSAAAVAMAHEIEAAGADVAIEHGVVTGEVRGLEVCRVVEGPADSRLEVGVGEQDRDAFQLVHGDRPTHEALADVVATVRTHRDLDAPQHPLNRLARERLLRWRLMESPDEIGLQELRPVPSPVPRAGLSDGQPCCAIGTDERGELVDVVVTTGIDLDAVPFVADVQRRAADDGRAGAPTMLVAPGRDLVPVTRELAALLRHPVELVAVG